MTLLHLDISGTRLTIFRLVNLARFGFRKSKTLLSVHMSNLRLRQEEIEKFRMEMSVKLHKQTPELASVKPNYFKSLMDQLNNNNNTDAQKLGNETKKKTKIVVQEIVRSSLFQASEDQKLVYQRMLGHPEILYGYQWREVSDEDCTLCNKMTQCLFVWN